MRSTVFNDRIDIEKINEPFLYKLKGRCSISIGMTCRAAVSGRTWSPAM